MPDGNMTPAIICLIFSSYFASVHARIKPADFDSGWLSIEAADRVNVSLARKNISHGLGETPLLVDVQVKAIDGPNKGYIFQAAGHQIRDDDYPQAYGNVVYVYNNESVIVSAPVRNDGYQVGKAIFIPSATFWDGPNQDYSSNSALFRVRAWKESSLPPAGFVSKSNILTAGTGNSSYLELFHGLREFPILVICRIRFPANAMNYANFYADSVGAGMIVYATNGSQNAGYVVYGYGKRSIRVWAPSLTSPSPRTLFDGTDGSGISVAVTSALLEVFAWEYRSGPLYENFNAYGEADDKREIFLSARDKGDSLTRVRAIAQDGANAIFSFPASGSLAYSEQSVANPCSYGGLVYAYNYNTIRFWLPRSPHGSTICIQDVFGNGTNSQSSSNVRLGVEIWTTGCGLPIIKFGNATLDSPLITLYGTTANVTCDFGFKPTRTSITCLSTGDWETANCVATDVNECSSGISPCSVYANCTNTVGSFTCQCKSGYTGNGQTCTDVNECSSGISPCSVYANCTNTLGSFTCQCKSGYTGNGQTCTGCDETPSIMFGTATLDDPNNSTFGATANVTCDFGFKPARTSITCLRTGKWETGYCIAKVLISPLCGLSWIYSVKNNVCYQIGIEQAKTWQAAREYCHQDGGDLLSISGVTEQNIIQAVLRNGQYANLENVYWIGATDQDKEGEWNWTDNTTFGYVNWHIGEPNNVSGTEDCAEIRLGPYWNYQWNGGNCDTEQNFICKKKSLDTKPATLPTHTDATIVTETVKSLPIVAIAAGAGGAGAAILVIIIVIVVCVCRKRNSAKASNGNKSTERCDIPDDGYIALAASGIRSPDSPPRKPEQIEEEKYHYLDESAMVDMSKLRVDISPIPPDRKDNPSGNENYNDGYLTASNTLITDPRPDYPKQDEYSNNTSDGYLVASSVGSRESGSGITNPAFRQINNGFL